MRSRKKWEGNVPALLALLWCGFYFAEYAAFADEIAKIPVPSSGSDLIIKTIKDYNAGREPSERITDGVRVTEGNSWQVAIVVSAIPNNFSAQFCGGSIINSKWIVTAAHCVDKNTLPGSIEIVYGTYDLRGGGTRVGVESIVINDHYIPKNRDADVALVKVSQAMSVQPIAVIDEALEGAYVKSGTLIRVTGWGRVGERGAKSPQLLLAEIPVQDINDCNAKDSYNDKLTGNMFCAGKPTGGKDACKGDSGGPAVVNINSALYLVGVISWGKDCGKPKKYGVYARIAKFTGWIGSRVMDN